MGVLASRNSNHHFAHLRIRLEILVGLDGLRERKYLRDLRTEPSISQPVVDIFLCRSQLLQIARDLHQRVTATVYPLAKRRQQREGCGWPGKPSILKAKPAYCS